MLGVRNFGRRPDPVQGCPVKEEEQTAAQHRSRFHRGPAHGKQEGVAYNGHFAKNCFHPIFSGCRENEINRLFSGWTVHLRRTTLAPPIPRRCAPHSFILAYLLHQFL
jgi:hypothetical protein